VAQVAIVTLGCPKNAVDSEGLGGLLVAGGHGLVAEAPEADVVVVNTCGFIDPARRETIGEVLDLAEMKAAGAIDGLVLTGCLVARSAGDLASSLPEVDALVDFAAYPRVAEIVARVANGTLAERVHGDPGTRFDPAWWDSKMAAGPRIRFGRAPWSYIKIAEGCNRGCTFCAIPLMRGKLRSRRADEIEAEARHLASRGVSELSLVSQDSVMWGRDSGEGDLPMLLRRLERVDGLRRLRLMYLHPQGVSDELVDTMLGSEVIVSYFDLSLQHVAPQVLKRMGRWGGRERFERMIGRIREGDPLAGVRATFILGFPGEREADADAVDDFVATAELDWIGVFTFSREESTRSYDFDQQVDPEEARARTERVSATAELTMSRRARALVGRTCEVLVERLESPSQGEGGQRAGQAVWVGRSQREAPEIDGEIRFSSAARLRVGDYVSVRIIDAVGADLVGRHCLPSP
jgi:ribosomal protein S12 methylthiotransferase